MLKSIVITGCSSGFGRATALRLASQGWRVFATVRKEADRDSLLAEAAGQAWQERLVPVLSDITRPQDVERLREVVAAETPALHALLNNAGTGYPMPLELIALDDLRAQLEINVVAQLAVIQALLPLLKAARGCVINVSSIGGRIAFPINGPYHMSKFALEAMSDALRVELAPFGVRVVVAEPGSSPTAIWETSARRADTEAARAGAYRPLMAAVKRAALAGAARGFPPAAFAGLIERILASPRPAPRYPFPASTAWMIRLRQVLPDRVWDWGVRRVLRW